MDLVQVGIRLPVERVETSRLDLTGSSCYCIIILITDTYELGRRRSTNEHLWRFGEWGLAPQKKIRFNI